MKFVLYVYATKGLLWFRVFDGYGLHIKDITRHPLIFSERMGITRRVSIGKWSIKLLKPSK